MLVLLLTLTVGTIWVIGVIIHPFYGCKLRITMSEAQIKYIKQTLSDSFLLFYMSTCVWYLQNDTTTLFLWFFPLKCLTVMVIIGGIITIIDRKV